MPTTFSVITVCYNAAACIEATIQSLTVQTWPQIDYVVVDGKSKDGTLAILEHHRTHITTMVSEPDNGIYDAMNKGIALSRGDVLFFLNADDAFCDAGVLADVAKIFDENPNLDLVYGNVVHKVGASGNDDAHKDARLVRHRFHWINERNVFFGDLCHQGVFARRRVFDKVGNFDLSYPINADYDWLLRAFKAHCQTHYVDRDICVFAEGGFHMQHPERQARERLAIKHKYHKPWQTWLGYWSLRVNLKWRKLRGEQIS